MDIEMMFEIFYSSYPKKKDKSKAFRAFKKLNPDEKLLNTILSALEMQKKDINCVKQNRQFMPYPSTYLNNRRWEDEADGEACGHDTQNKAFGSYL